MEEVFKDIKGFEGLYQVSNMGRVKSLRRTFIDKSGRKQGAKERILKPIADSCGYLVVNLSSGDKQKKIKVHRLVCAAFHKNPANKPCVNHIDENKANNVASNLEWCTYEENNNHGSRNERAAKAIAKAKSKQIGQYALDGKLIKVWASAREAQRKAGFSFQHISDVANGKRKTHKNFIWKYI